jgi:acrylyl-CoA reductase (NADPH)
VPAEPPPGPFPAFVVRAAVVAGEQGPPTHGTVEAVTLEQLPPGDVVIEVACSSLNYKDALAAQGHPGIVGGLPHVPGIDAAGLVVWSAAPAWKPGDRVLVTGYELGSGCWGGYARYIRVPGEWPVALPEDVSYDEAMAYGTAGFTAAQCVAALERQEITPDRGPIVVTGATGGVGSLSVALLAQLGYEVAAVTGKPDQEAWLRELGAADVLPRSAVDDASSRPLLSSRWAGAIDTVGGRPLATLLRSLRHRGCVAACGLTAGVDVPLTVHPFILRGVTLAGIDSAKCPRGARLAIWDKLFGPWRLPPQRRRTTERTLGELSAAIGQMLAGRAAGRTLIRPASD